MRYIGLILLSLCLAVLPAAAQVEGGTRISPENVLMFELETGRVFIEMFPDVAPAHVERIRGLASQGFYDGVIFHRVIRGFMAQGGDPTGTGTGSSDLPDLPAEFSPIPHRKGIVSMARSRSPNSANSQFFIMLADTAPNGSSWSQLDGTYTVWGRVIDGMEFVEQIAEGEPPADPTVILRARTVATEFPEASSFPGPPPLAAREAYAAQRAEDFDPLFETDVQIDILSPILRTP
ncbi:peptidylprolyl isomerase [bacterium AH-315-P15]|nr:peptidylprolyl isomerase [bacterium AH-315-P15]